MSDELGAAILGAIVAGIIVLGVFVAPPARCEDRVVIKDNYGKTVGSITRDPVEKDRYIIKDQYERRTGSLKEERARK